MVSPLRMNHIMAVSDKHINQRRRACLMAGLAELFPTFGNARAAHVDWHAPFPYGSYGEHNILRHRQDFSGRLVMYVGQTHCPAKEAKALLEVGGYPLFAHLWAEQPHSCNLTMGGYNLRFDTEVHLDHSGRWYTRRTAPRATPGPVARGGFRAPPGRLTLRPHQRQKARLHRRAFLYNRPMPAKAGTHLCHNKAV